jgi:DNA-directed RNA polymerase subunit alpha
MMIGQFKCPECGSLLIVVGPDKPDVKPVDTEFLKKRIDAIDWGPHRVRITNACKNDGLETIADLMQRSETRLLSTPNFGRISLNRMKEILSEHGLILERYGW